MIKNSNIEELFYTKELCLQLYSLCLQGQRYHDGKVNGTGLGTPQETEPLLCQNYTNINVLTSKDIPATYGQYTSKSYNCKILLHFEGYQPYETPSIRP